MRPLRFTRSRDSERAARSLGETMARRREGMKMDDRKATRVLRCLDADESRPRYCSDAGAADLHRLNAEAIRFALQAIEDRAALVMEYGRPFPYAEPVVSVARRHMKGEE